jgi:hypothetical protein
MVPELHLFRFSSLFATSRSRSHFSRDFPSPTTFRPQAFAASRRFAPRTRLRACFIPLPRPGFSLFRGFSPRAATLPRRKKHAPLPLFHRRFTRLLPLSQKPPRSHVRCSSASRLLSTQGRVPRLRLFTSAAPAPLYSFVSSRSLPLSTSVPSYSAPSAHDVRELGLRAFRELRFRSRPYGARAHLAVHPISKRRSPFGSRASAALTFRPVPPRASFQPRVRSPCDARLQLPFDNPPEPSSFDAGPPWPSVRSKLQHLLDASVLLTEPSTSSVAQLLPRPVAFRHTSTYCDYLAALAPNAHRCSFIFSVLSSRDPTARRYLAPACCA